jgi:uncharacterized membrane protein
MDFMLILTIISRWIHVLSVVVAVGGSIFMRFVLLPSAMAALDDERHAALRETLLGRWRKVIHTCVALLLISGGFNLWRAIVGGAPPLYHALFGIKFLLALAVFFLAIVLTSSRMKLFADKASAAKWSAILVVLATVLIMISGVLKYIPRAVVVD